MSASLYLLYRKNGDLEEELKNVTNTLKSLEAQVEKVGKSCVFLSFSLSVCVCDGVF